MQFIEKCLYYVCCMSNNIYGNLKYVYVQHLKPCTLKKKVLKPTAFVIICIKSMLIMLFACLYILFISSDNPGGSGAPQRVGAPGGENLGGGCRQRSEHTVPAALHLPLRLPRRGGGRGAPGRWHHTSTHLPPNPAPSSPALRRRPAGRVNASHKTAASSAHSGSSWTATTTQPGEGREQGKGPAPTSFLPCYYYWSSAGEFQDQSRTLYEDRHTHSGNLLYPRRQPTAKQAPGQTTSPGSINQSINCANFVCFQTCNF